MTGWVFERELAVHIGAGTLTHARIHPLLHQLVPNIMIRKGHDG
jgi:hypothetical protein